MRPHTQLRGGLERQGPAVSGVAPLLTALLAAVPPVNVLPEPAPPSPARGHHSPWPSQRVAMRASSLHFPPPAPAWEAGRGGDKEQKKSLWECLCLTPPQGVTHGCWEFPPRLTDTASGPLGAESTQDPSPWLAFQPGGAGLSVEEAWPASRLPRTLFLRSADTQPEGSCSLSETEPAWRGLTGHCGQVSESPDRLGRSFATWSRGHHRHGGGEGEREARALSWPPHLSVNPNAPGSAVN